jgi:hypothetical protein
MPKHIVIIQGHPDVHSEQRRVTWPPLFVWRTKEDAITWGFELPHKLQGKAHYAKRQVTRKFGMTVKVSTE